MFYSVTQSFLNFLRILNGLEVCVFARAVILFNFLLFVNGKTNTILSIVFSSLLLASTLIVYEIGMPKKYCCKIFIAVAKHQLI
jgi:hypothetical protein